MFRQGVNNAEGILPEAKLHEIRAEMTTETRGLDANASLPQLFPAPLYNRDLPNAPMPDEPLAFIRDCIVWGRIHWTYHVTMRMQERLLTREVLRRALPTLEIIETNPDDKYLPSFLTRGEVPEFVFHALIATDLDGYNIRVVTMYLPNARQWDDNGRTRRIAK